jgi:hypothetical protein
MAMLAVGGAYQPQPSLADRIRTRRTGAWADERRNFNLALIVGWGMIAAGTATFRRDVPGLLGPKVLKEPKKQWRMDKLEAYSQPQLVDDKFKKTPDGGTGFWIVNLQRRRTSSSR